MPQKSTVCLNMIVKNEAKVICRAFDSVKSNIDSWVIVDTGSTDGTQDIIREHFKDIPGKLYERKWRNFAYNRNQALRLAKGSADYLLFLDADDQLVFHEGFTFSHLTADEYLLYSRNNGVRFIKWLMVKASLPWKWKGVVHEHLFCGQEVKRVLLNEHQITLIKGHDGSSYSDPHKGEKYIALLEKEHLKHPKNTRTLFELARTYDSLHKWDKALHYYEQRARLDDTSEEQFLALLCVGRCQMELQYPHETVVKSFLKSHIVRPDRAEPIYCLADYFNRQKQYELAYSILHTYLSTLHPHPFDCLFVHEWMEEYGLLCQLALSTYCLGRKEEAQKICKNILAHPKLPVEHRKLIEEYFSEIL